MAFTERRQSEPVSSKNATSNPREPSAALHRIGEARRRQGLSLRTVARRMHQAVAEVRSQEDNDADLQLSTLYRWREVLDVPIEELLVEPNETFSLPVLRQTQMIRFMKTTLTILSVAKDESVRTLANMMVNQLVEIMPELKRVRSPLSPTDWPTSRKIGRAAEYTFPDTLFDERLRPRAR